MTRVMILLDECVAGGRCRHQVEGCGEKYLVVTLPDEHDRVAFLCLPCGCIKRFTHLSMLCPICGKPGAAGHYRTIDGQEVFVCPAVSERRPYEWTVKEIAA